MSTVRDLRKKAAIPIDWSLRNLQCPKSDAVRKKKPELPKTVTLHPKTPLTYGSGNIIRLSNHHFADLDPTKVMLHNAHDWLAGGEITY